MRDDGIIGFMLGFALAFILFLFIICTIACTVETHSTLIERGIMKHHPQTGDVVWVDKE